MKMATCPVCGARVRRNQLAAHRASAHRRRRTPAWKVQLAAAVMIVVVVAAAYLAMQYLRDRGEEGAGVPPVTDPNAIPVQFQTEDGWTIHGTFYKGDPSKPLLILVHGLNEDRNAYGSFVPELRAKGYNILAFDSRGHGQSVVYKGTTKRWTAFTDLDFKDMVNDIYSAKAWAMSSYATAPKVGIIGASIGANEALTYFCQTDAQDDIALVLLAPGENYRGYYSAPAISALNAQGATAHIFFGAAEDDQGGSAAAARSLNASYNGPKQLEIMSGGRHGTQLLTDPPYRVKIADFLADAFSG